MIKLITYIIIGIIILGDMVMLYACIKAGEEADERLAKMHEEDEDDN